MTVLCLINFKDHLHIRGEHHSIVFIKVGVEGSPPHTWRTQQFKVWLPINH